LHTWYIPVPLPYSPKPSLIGVCCSSPAFITLHCDAVLIQDSPSATHPASIALCRLPPLLPSRLQLTRAALRPSALQLWTSFSRTPLPQHVYGHNLLHRPVEAQACAAPGSGHVACSEGRQGCGCSGGGAADHRAVSQAAVEGAHEAMSIWG
jgi:hypothetical protein